MDLKVGATAEQAYLGVKVESGPLIIELGEPDGPQKEQLENASAEAVPSPQAEASFYQKFSDSGDLAVLLPVITESHVPKNVVYTPTDRGAAPSEPLTPHYKWIIGIAFSLCFLSNAVGHFIREPLFTTKVNIQKSFGSSTIQLSYLDISYLASYSIGQFITPIVFPRSHIVMFACFFHFLLGVCHFLLFTFRSLTGFVVMYGVTGFSCAILWLALYNDLHSWLPLDYRLVMITFWCCAAELGLILGTFMCANVQTTTRWKELFMITSLLNFLMSLLLFACYIKPRPNSEQPDFLEEYVPRQKLFDPVNISRENTRKIVDGAKALYNRAPVPLDTLPTTNVDTLEAGRARRLQLMLKFIWRKVLEFFARAGRRVARVVRVHCDVVRRVNYLMLYMVGFNSLKSARNCFAFWISFYLTTVLRYSIQHGIYATLIFQLGSCFGSVIGGLLSKLVLREYHLTSCTISSLFSFITLSSIYFIDLGALWKCFTYVFLVGLATNCTELLIISRGLKSLCEQSLEEAENDYAVSLGTTLSIGNLLSVIQGYVSIYIAHNFGWSYMFMYLCLMMLLSTGALGVPSRHEILRIAEPLL